MRSVEKNTLDTRGCLTHTSHGALKVTKHVHALKIKEVIHYTRMSDSVPYGVMY